MSLLWHVGHFLRDVGRDIQCRLEGAVLGFGDFARAAHRADEGVADDDVPDLVSSMARFERMLRLLEENRAWPDETLRLEDDEEFNTWRDWPISIAAARSPQCRRTERRAPLGQIASAEPARALSVAIESERSSRVLS
jgi:hypothetical protein